MKFDQLRSIGHNIADSLACGMGFPIGVYQTDIFGEARRSPEGFIAVDFLTGATEGGPASASLARAVALYRGALADLCQRHGASPSAFRHLTARYSADSHGPRFAVTVEDQTGRRAVDDYAGLPGRRLQADALERVRPDERP